MKKIIPSLSTFINENSNEFIYSFDKWIDKLTYFKDSDKFASKTDDEIETDLTWSKLKKELKAAQKNKNSVYSIAQKYGADINGNTDNLNLHLPNEYKNGNLWSFGKNITINKDGNIYFGSDSTEGYWNNNGEFHDPENKPYGFLALSSSQRAKYVDKYIYPAGSRMD
jgi:hypothetical protein